MPSMIQRALIGVIAGTAVGMVGATGQHVLAPDQFRSSIYVGVEAVAGLRTSALYQIGSPQRAAVLDFRRSFDVAFREGPQSPGVAVSSRVGPGDKSVLYTVKGPEREAVRLTLGRIHSLSEQLGQQLDSKLRVTSMSSAPITKNGAPAWLKLAVVGLLCLFSGALWQGRSIIARFEFPRTKRRRLSRSVSLSQGRN